MVLKGLGGIKMACRRRILKIRNRHMTGAKSCGGLPPLFSAYDSTFESKGSGKTFAHGLVRNTAVGSNTPPPGVVSV